MKRITDLQDRAWELQDAWRLSEAAAPLEQAIALAEQDRECSPLDLANLLNDLADVEDLRGRYEEALRLASRARELTLGGDQGEDAVRIRVRSLDRIAAVHRVRGEYERADDALSVALAIAVVRLGDSAAECTQIRNSLGMTFKYAKRWDQASEMYERVLADLEPASGGASDELAAIYHNLGGLMHARNDFAGAEEPSRRAWMISRRLHGDTVTTALHAVAYAAVLDGLGRHGESIAIVQGSLGCLEAALGADHPEVAAALHNLAAALDAAGETARAVSCYRRSLLIRERTLGSSAPESTLTRENLGRLLCRLGSADEGVSLLTGQSSCRVSGTACASQSRG